MKKSLLKRVWSEEGYYKISQEGSLDFGHPAMRKLAEVSKGARKILDMGCGEGTRLGRLIKDDKKGYGIDISPKAIAMAEEKYPRLSFKVGDLENLPFKSGEFDLVYSAFVFEHLDSPEKVLKEGMRVLKKGGRMMIIAPNFGAPNRASPPFRGSRVLKLIAGSIRDIFPPKAMSWHKVKPIAKGGVYEIDWDTTIEPYLGSLIHYLKSKRVNMLYFSSFWDRELPNAGFFQKTLKILGNMGLYPFNLWGPHLAVIVEK